MKRRDFIRYGVPIATVPFLIKGVPVRAMANSRLLNLLQSQANNNKVLVIIQLSGGNDGLNMVIPIDQYSGLSYMRSNILIDEKLVLPLTGTKATGLHPAMTGLQNTFSEGKVRILQGIGYQNFNFSHFTATDIYQQAIATTNNTDQQAISTPTTGWLGRYLDIEYPGFPNGYPNANYPDPPAIQLGAIVSGAIQGVNGIDGIAIASSSDFYQLSQGNNLSQPTPFTAYGRELAYIRLITLQTQLYTDAIKKAANKATNLSPYYLQESGLTLTNQLKIVAQLIAGGLTTKIYLVNQGGYDTHHNQVATTGGTDKGSHADLLGELSSAIYAFQDDLHRHGIEDQVVGMTYSEFGRRIQSNGSIGTDHGTSQPMIVFGTQVIPGFLGVNPTIGNNAAASTNLELQNDFRHVYYSLLKDWLGVSQDQLPSVITTTPGDDPTNPNGPYNTSLAIIKQPGVNYPFGSSGVLSQNYPNPFKSTTTIPYVSKGGETIIDYFDVLGRNLGIILQGSLPEGPNSIIFNGQTLASGVYYYRIQTGGAKQVLAMVKV